MNADLTKNWHEHAGNIHCIFTKSCLWSGNRFIDLKGWYGYEGVPFNLWQQLEHVAPSYQCFIGINLMVLLHAYCSVFFFVALFLQGVRSRTTLTTISSWIRSTYLVSIISAFLVDVWYNGLVVTFIKVNYLGYNSDKNPISCFILSVWMGL